MTIIRQRHAFEGRSLAVISIIRRRGVLLVLVVLPDGSRSLIPASWTDWRAEQAGRTSTDDDGGGGHDLGRLGDLLHLRKVIDALYGRRIESVPCKESSHAIEPGFSQPAKSFTKPLCRVGDGVEPARRIHTHRGVGDSGASDRPHALGQIDEGDKR